MNEAAKRVTGEELENERIGFAPETESIHAGLECGTIISRLGSCDTIAIGPNVYDIHSPDERLDLASLERFWKLVLKLIKA